MTTEVDTVIEDAVRSLVLQAIAAETQQIEADLLSIPGVHLAMTPEEVALLGLEIVHQVAPDSLGTRYRGIRQHGAWVIDRHPKWRGPN